jgi:hypothetical protein
MAETEPLPPKDSLHQAGGGLAGSRDVTVKEITSSVMPYLEKIYKEYAGKSLPRCCPYSYALLAPFEETYRGNRRDTAHNESSAAPHST